MQSKLKVLFCVPPGFKQQGIHHWPSMLERVQASLDKHISSFDTVTSTEEYDALPGEKKSSYDAFVVQMGGSATKVLDAQMKDNKSL